MTQSSLPWDGSGGAGDDGPYSAAQWQVAWAAMSGIDLINNVNQGVLLGVLNTLGTIATTPASGDVTILSGAALVQGIFYISTATETLTPAANGSGSTRYDVVVLRATWAAGSEGVRLALRQGTPGAGIPALTQVNGTTWEIPLAYLELASGFTNISDSMIFDMRIWANVPPRMMSYVQNKSGGVLNRGDIVVWDSTNDDGVTTSTTLGAAVAGVTVGYIPANGYGYITNIGAVLVNVGSATSRGDLLTQSTVATEAIATTTQNAFGIVTLGTAGAGLARAYVNCEPAKNLFVTTKGDLLTRSATGFTRLGVGTNQQTLIANSSEASGLQWVARVRMATGTYTGGGAATQAITGVGFQPKKVEIWSQVNFGVSGASEKITKTDQDGIYAKGDNQRYEADYIISLDADGFTVGDGTGGSIAGNPTQTGIAWTWVAYTF